MTKTTTPISPTLS